MAQADHWATPAPPCPRCGATGAKRLVYGLVDYELFLELGDVAPNFELGWLRKPAYDWRCAACGHEWCAES